MKRRLGVCYYPEHWPESQWATDAARMAETGITWVRIGEFAWAQMEPEPGVFDWGWLDRAIDTLGAAGLKVVLGTPSATPPRWMIHRWPDMLAIGRDGRPRDFGSRRHYCFSHAGYREESRRIARALAERYGRTPHVGAWQIDNEYGCHDTTLSYSASALQGFRDWLAHKYQSVQALNRAWGTAFWSMDYADFNDIGLPNTTVCEPAPAHALDFRRFASAEVAAFNRIQVDEIRRHSSAPIAHNYMGAETSFDHWTLGRQMEIASWDSYPIGFLSDRVETTDKRRQAFLRQGDPDNQAFHHDLYRGIGHGRWWVMEQQPGPVNWAPWNPAPLPGMARLWAWEAFAHGAETVSYFRWRQAPFAQEQMHAGLMRPDDQPAPALAEAARVAAELAEAPDVETAPADVAIVFDYVSAWAWEAQPQGRDFSYFQLVVSAYRACRRAGLNIDIIPPDTADLSPWPMVLAPGLMAVPAPLRAALASYRGRALIGPRSDTKTDTMSIPLPLGPNVPGLDVSVVMTESLPPQEKIRLNGKGRFERWFEHLQGSAPVLVETRDGRPAVMGGTHLRYVAGWPNDVAWDWLLRGLAQEAGIATHDLPDGLRLRRSDTRLYVFNYGRQPQRWNGRKIGAADLHIEPI